jgi:hypothetical protein
VRAVFDCVHISCAACSGCRRMNSVLVLIMHVILLFLPLAGGTSAVALRPYVDTLWTSSSQGILTVLSWSGNSLYCLGLVTDCTLWRAYCMMGLGCRSFGACIGRWLIARWLHGQLLLGMLAHSSCDVAELEMTTSLCASVLQ